MYKSYPLLHFNQTLLAIIVFKPKQHLEQQIGLNYITNFEMTHLNVQP